MNNTIWKKDQSGQIGLIVLLTMIVAATVAIAVATRSVGELKMSRQEEQSTGAFGDAETAVEEALADIANKSPGQSYQTSAGAVYKVDSASSLALSDVPPGKVVEVKLENSNGNLDLSFEPSVAGLCNNRPAIVVAIINQVGDVRRTAYDLCSRGNNFIHDLDGNVSVSININDRLARIKVLYVSANIDVTGNIPVQQYTVNSSARGADGETRSIEATRGLPMAPSIFDYVLFAGSGSLQP